MEFNLLCVIVGIITLIIGVFFGIAIRKNVAEKKIFGAEEEAKRILNEAIKNAENKQREAMVEAKEAILTARNEWEKEEKERRADLQKQEHRLQQKEENLDRKTDNIEKKEETLQNKLADLERTREEIDVIENQKRTELERISGMTAEEAKDLLISQLEAEVTHESAAKIKEAELRYKEDSDSMPEAYLRPLELKFICEYSDREIAHDLGITLGAVQQRIRRGRVLLIQKLREDGYDRETV